jgi:ribonucleotide monophosphatase NagD (HAD superfamily)
VQPEVTGKPSAALAERLLDGFTDGEDLVVVGDHTAEVELARAMGARSVLLLSGATTRQDAAALPAATAPDLVFPDIGTVHDLVRPHLTPAVGAPR